MSRMTENLHKEVVAEVWALFLHLVAAAWLALDAETALLDWIQSIWLHINCKNNIAVHIGLSSSPHPSGTWLPFPDPKSAGGYFLLKGNFPILLLPKCLLKGDHMIVEVFSVL